MGLDREAASAAVGDVSADLEVLRGLVASAIDEVGRSSIGWPWGLGADQGELESLAAMFPSLPVDVLSTFEVSREMQLGDLILDYLNPVDYPWWHVAMGVFQDAPEIVRRTSATNWSSTPPHTNHEYTQPDPSPTRQEWATRHESQGVCWCEP